LLLALPFFSFHVPSPTDFYTLSLHDALPILFGHADWWQNAPTVTLFGQERSIIFNVLAVGIMVFLTAILVWGVKESARFNTPDQDRKSTRLNSSHRTISYAVFCLKKKTKQQY